jgi:hypothetical protein
LQFDIDEMPSELQLLRKIIDEHFLASDKKEVFSLFQKYKLFDLITEHTRQLELHLQKAVLNNKGAPITIISTATSNLLISVNSQLANITDPEEKRKIEQVTASLGIRILLSVITYFPEQAEQILEAVKESLELTSELRSYKFEAIKELMNLEDLQMALQSMTGSRQAKEIRRVGQNGIPTLTWTERCHVDFLTNELKKREWIKSRSQFSKLFGNKDQGLIINWNMDHKYELARLLFKLHEDDFIRAIKTTRGLFSIAERHIRDYNNKPLTKNALKKISS